MGSDVSPDDLRGFGLPLRLSTENLWTAQAGYTQAGPQPGVPQPQGDYDLRLASSGTQAADKQLRIRTQRAGNPGPDGAAFVWKNEPDTYWRGRDIQQISAWDTLDYTTLVAAASSDPDALTLPDGTVVIARQKLLAGSYRVRIAYQSPTSTTWAFVDAYTSSTTPTDGYHPAMCLMPDGSILLAFWVYDNAANEAQIQTMRSTDGAASWSTVSTFALDTPADIQSSPGAGNAGVEVDRLRMSESNGQVLVVARTTSNNTSLSQRTGYIQAVSIDAGGRFVTVETSTPGTFQFKGHSVITVGGQFYVMAVTGNSVLSGMRLSSGFEKISAAENAGLISVTTSIDLSDEGSAWVDDDGTIWFIGEESSSGQTMFMVESVDGGDSFRFVGNGTSSADNADWFSSGDAGVHPVNFVGTASVGRQVIATAWTSDVDTAGSYSTGIIYLGGYSTVTLPGAQTYASSYQRLGWGQTWLPLDKPDDISSGPWTLTGTDTATLASGALTINTSSQQTCYGANPSGSVADGCVVRMSLTAVSGGSTSTLARGAKVRLADGSSDYEVALRISTAGMRLVDNNSGANLGEVSDIAPSGGIDILLAMTGGKVAMFYRAKSVAADRVWSVGPQSSSLTNNSGSPAANNAIEWGHCASGTAETSWEELHYRFDQSYSPALSAGFSNPADLFGRSYAGVGAATYVDGGVRITAIDGAAREGETYNIDTRYRYPIDRILWTESQSPRVGWRSTADNTSTLIPFLLNADESSPGSSTQGILGDMLILHMSAINFANFTIEYYAGGSWNVAATVDTALTGGTWNATRTSNTITMPTGGSNTSKSHLFQNECAGWTAKIGSSLYRIARNAPGVLAAGNGSNFKRVRLEVEGTTGSTEVGALELWPDSVTVAINLRGIQGSAWGIRIAAEHTVDDDYRIGQLMLGRAFITGYQYARGRVLTYEPNTPTTITADGVLRGRKVGPGGRLLRFAWTDPVDGTATYGTNTSPSFITGSTSAGSLPLASRADVGASLEGMFREIGQNQPFVYLPSVPRSTSTGTDVIVLNRRQQHMAMTLTTPVELESVLGDEDSSEIFRVASITAREIR